MCVPFIPLAGLQHILDNAYLIVVEQYSVLIRRDAGRIDRLRLRRMGKCGEREKTGKDWKLHWRQKWKEGVMVIGSAARGHVDVGILEHLLWESFPGNM
jgi:hypothetical protein